VDAADAVAMGFQVVVIERFVQGGQRHRREAKRRAHGFRSNSWFLQHQNVLARQRTLLRLRGLPHRPVHGACLVTQDATPVEWPPRPTPWNCSIRPSTHEKSMRGSVEHAQDLVRLRLDLFAVETHGPIELRVFPGKLPVGVLAEMILLIF